MVGVISLMIKIGDEPYPQNNNGKDAWAVGIGKLCYPLRSLKGECVETRVESI